jgi:hypothetical protein
MSEIYPTKTAPEVKVEKSKIETPKVTVREAKTANYHSDRSKKRKEAEKWAEVMKQITDNNTSSNDTFSNDKWTPNLIQANTSSVRQNKTVLTTRDWSSWEKKEEGAKKVQNNSTNIPTTESVIQQWNNHIQQLIKTVETKIANVQSDPKISPEDKKWMCDWLYALKETYINSQKQYENTVQLYDIIKNAQNEIAKITSPKDQTQTQIIETLITRLKQDRYLIEAQDISKIKGNPVAVSQYLSSKYTQSVEFIACYDHLSDENHINIAQKYDNVQGQNQIISSLQDNDVWLSAINLDNVANQSLETQTAFEQYSLLSSTEQAEIQAQLQQIVDISQDPQEIEKAQKLLENLCIYDLHNQDTQLYQEWFDNEYDTIVALEQEPEPETEVEAAEGVNIDLSQPVSNNNTSDNNTNDNNPPISNWTNTTNWNTPNPWVWNPDQWWITDWQQWEPKIVRWYLILEHPNNTTTNTYYKPPIWMDYTIDPNPTWGLIVNVTYPSHELGDSNKNVAQTYISPEWTVLWTIEAYANIADTTTISNYTINTMWIDIPWCFHINPYPIQDHDGVSESRKNYFEIQFEEWWEKYVYDSQKNILYNKEVTWTLNTITINDIVNNTISMSQSQKFGLLFGKRIELDNKQSQSILPADQQEEYTILKNYFFTDTTNPNQPVLNIDHWTPQEDIISYLTWYQQYINTTYQLYTEYDTVLWEQLLECQYDNAQNSTNQMSTQQWNKDMQHYVAEKTNNEIEDMQHYVVEKTKCDQMKDTIAYKYRNLELTQYINSVQNMQPKEYV